MRTQIVGDINVMLTLLINFQDQVVEMDMGRPCSKHTPFRIVLANGYEYYYELANQAQQEYMIQQINYLSGDPDWEDATHLKIKTDTQTLHVEKRPDQNMIVNGSPISQSTSKDEIGVKLRLNSANTLEPDEKYRKLVKLALSFNAIDTQGVKTKKTALHCAVAENNYKKACILIQNGARLDIEDAQSRTPLKIAEQYGKFSPEQMKIFHGGKPVEQEIKEDISILSMN